MIYGFFGEIINVMVKHMEVSKLINVRVCSIPRGISPFTFFKQRGEQEEMMHFPVVQSIFNKSKYPVQLEKHI